MDCSGEWNFSKFDSCKSLSEELEVLGDVGIEVIKTDSVVIFLKQWLTK